MAGNEDEESQLRAVAARNAESIVHARRRAEEELRKQSAWLRVTLSSIGDAVISTDADGRVSFMNGVAESLTGWTQSEALGRPLPEVFRIVNESSREPVENHVIRALRGGVVVGLANHTVLISRDGTERPIDDSAAPIRDERGGLAGSVLVFRDITERKRAEAILREGEARKTAMFEAALDCIISIDHGGTIVEFNSAAERTFGHRREDVLGRELATVIIPPAYRERHRQGMARYLATGVGAVINKRLELSALRADGSEFPVELTVTRVPVDGPPLFTAYLRDITDRTRAEQALRHRTAQFETLFNQAPMGVYLVDADLRILEVNPTALPVFGNIPDLIGRDFDEVVHLIWPRARADEVVRVFRRTLDTGEPYVAPEWIEDRIDRPVTEYYQWQISRIPLPGGRFGVVCYFRDISAEVRSRLAIARAGERLRFMAESMPQKIFTATPDGRVDYFNPQWIEFTGLSFEQIRDWGWTQFIHPDDVAENVRAWERSINTTEPFQFEHRFRRADGEYRWHISRAMALKDAGGGVLMWVGSNTDIHDLKEAEHERETLLAREQGARTEAERASRLKDDFLATLSHELRTPLNAILGWTHILSKKPVPDDTLEQGLLVITRNARAQAQLIADLLDMSRVISGKMRMDVQRVELPVVIAAALESVRPGADAKGVRLQSVVEPITDPVHGDPTRLQQIVWNLLSNAVKFTPRDGRVQVVLARVNSHVELSVSDTGTGIRPEFLPHVFERFRQADSSASREHGGLGLGLAIVKQLVELHGGSVHAASGGEGKGSTFTVHLPLAVLHSAPPEQQREHPRAVTLAPAHYDPTDLSGVRVLVVDDEADSRDLVRRVLEGCGARVVQAGSTDEALLAVARERVDVILSDIGMPARDGYEFMKTIRTNGIMTPAAALTAFARSEDRARTLNAGYQTHIAKPVEPAELLAAVASLARMSRGDGPGAGA